MFKKFIFALVVSTLAVGTMPLRAVNPGPSATPTATPTPCPNGKCTIRCAPKPKAPAKNEEVDSLKNSAGVTKSSVKRISPRRPGVTVEGGVLGSVENSFSLGQVHYIENGIYKSEEFYWQTYSANIDDTTYQRPTVDAIRQGRLGVVIIGDNGSTSGTAKVRQILTDKMLADVQDLPNGGKGFVISIYPRSQVGNMSGGLYTLRANATVQTVTYEQEGTTRMRITFKDSISEKSKSWVWSTSGNNWTLDQYGDSPNDTAQTTFLTRTNKAGGYSQTRVVANATSHGPVNVSHIQEDYITSLGDEPKLVKQITQVDDDNTASIWTAWTYYDDAKDTVSFGKVKTVRRSDGYWENWYYTAGNAGIVTTKTVSPWLNSLVDDEAHSLVVTTVEDEHATVLSREEKIQGLVVASESTSRTTLQGGDVQETKTVKASASPIKNLVTTTIYYNASATDIQAGRPKSIQNPDGTVAIYSYSQDITTGKITITEDKGTGSIYGITNGIRTETLTDAANNLLDERKVAIQSGGGKGGGEAIEIYHRTAVTDEPDSMDAYGKPQKYYYFGNLADCEELKGSCCGMTDSERDRNGRVTSYTYDNLGRRTRAVSTYDNTSYTEDEATVYDGLTTTVTRRVGALSLLVRGSTQDMTGNTISEKAPDADNDAQHEAEETTIHEIALNEPAHDKITLGSFLNGGHPATGIGKRTTRTNPDGGTVVTETYADGQTKRVYGTAVAPTSYVSGTWSGGKFTQTIGVAADMGTNEWVKSYTDMAGRLVKVEKPTSDGQIATTSYTNDGAGRVTAVTDPDNVTTLYAYDANGEQTIQATDMNGNGSIDFDGTDRIVETVNSYVSDGVLGICKKTVTRVYAHDNDGTPTVVSTQFTAVNGRGTRTESLLSGTQTTVQTLPVNGAWTVTTTKPDGTQQVDEYTLGRLVISTLKDSSGVQISKTTLDYDTWGRVQHSTDARTGRTTYTYYDNGAVWTQTSPYNDTNDTTTYARDKMGRVLHTYLPDNNTQHMTYYPTGQVASLSGSQTYPQHYTYDAQGRMTTLDTYKDGAQSTPQTTTWNYDSATGLLTSKIYADNKGTLYTYTLGGRLETRTWARNVTTTYVYNTPAKDLTAINYSNDTPSVAVSYNRVGKRTSVVNSVSAINYFYNGKLQLEWEETASTDTSGSVFSTWLQRNYDTRGRPKGIQLMSSNGVDYAVGYGYDTAGRLSTVTPSVDTPSPANTFTYGYEPGSTRLIATLTGPAPAGTPVVSVTNTWEPARNILAAKENKGGGNVISRYDYGVNSLGQRTSVQQSGNAFSPAAFNRYDYDPLGQLTAAKRYTGGTVSVPLNPVEGQQFGFTFDAIGNRKTANADADAGATSYTANAVNQYTAIGAATPTYDADGNIYCEGDRPYEWNGGRTYVWDAENRLIFVTDNGHWMIYKYDALGRRVAKYYDNPDYSHSTRSLSYDGWNLIQETGTDASLSAGGDLSMSGYIVTYTWGQDLSGSLQGAGGVGGLLTRTVYQSALNAEPATTYYTYDGNGNVSELVDAAGTIAAHYEYGPFGEPVNMTSSSGAVAWQNPFRFSTKYTDDETGFVYYGYRYYDSGKGRWISRDPIGESGGFNLYSFCFDAAVGLYDINGLSVPGPAPCPAPKYPPGSTPSYIGTSPSFFENFFFGPSAGAERNNTGFFDTRFHGWMKHANDEFKKEINRWIKEHCGQSSFPGPSSRQPVVTGVYALYGDEDESNWEEGWSLGRFAIDYKTPVSVSYVPTASGRVKYFWKTSMYIADTLGLQAGDPFYDSLHSLFPSRNITRAVWEISDNGECCKK